MTRTIVLRLGHRIPRDWRLTTHVCLTARALGADGVIIADTSDKGVEETVQDVTHRFGGQFSIETGTPWKQAIRRWKYNGGTVVHLTAYGLPLPKVIEELRGSGKDVLVVVGSEKVPGELFGLADWNVSVTNQPMSEVGALAVFLDWFQSHEEFEKKFENSRVRIVPSETGKQVIETPESQIEEAVGSSEISGEAGISRSFRTGERRTQIPAKRPPKDAISTAGPTP